MAERSWPQLPSQRKEKSVMNYIVPFKIINCVEFEVDDMIIIIIIVDVNCNYIFLVG